MQCRCLTVPSDESLAKAKQELIDSREEMSAWRCQYDSLHRKYKIQEASTSCFQVSQHSILYLEGLLLVRLEGLLLGGLVCKWNA